MADKLFHLRLLDAARDYGEDVALTEAETLNTLTFAELRQRSYALAAHWKNKYELRKGDIVLCFMRNNNHYPVAFLASAVLGCSLSGISPDLKEDEIRFAVDKTQCKLIVTTDDLTDYLKPFTMPVFVVDQWTPVLVNTDENAPICDEEIAEDDVLLTPFSSGTTGLPKCVLLTHKNFNAATDILKREVFDHLTHECGGRRTTVAFLPFYHASGFWALCYCLLAGHHSVIFESFSAEFLLNVVEEYKVDTLNLVPALANFLVDSDITDDYDLSCVKTVLCGSGSISAEKLCVFMDKFPRVERFLQGYGMTEVVVLSHITPVDLPRDDDKHRGSCGKLLEGFDAKVVDESGVECTEPGMRGELWLKSDCVMKGYLNDEDATKETLDEDGWYRTGDVVYFDADGFYYVVDRLKDMIKVNGLQVSPSQLEALLLANESVHEAAVIGVPDESHGEIPKAFVALKKDAEVGEDFVEHLAKSVNERVAPFKQLRGGIEVVRELPKTASGKVSKTALKALEASKEAEEVNETSI